MSWALLFTPPLPAAALVGALPIVRVGHDELTGVLKRRSCPRVPTDEHRARSAARRRSRSSVAPTARAAARRTKAANCMRAG